ncbi:uncharacterized protein PHALS_14581 [Plasmopara halstedii]|uniref:Uncharacterized protein n=1 Tax=Plasmopara halstedii TaxID=4781 RepID=A0A0P1AKY2_PLAHL|nr:uncharacterized protein PHALS_14581 [Plasmopara halstedii]CEG41945.1 hypothetical protein PHALS_14581 [Plasmopara halstedii]|eukprot:XP_024578314.1 hypothetical protein PHALS_14581 [Plasmopara halstedii]
MRRALGWYRADGSTVIETMEDFVADAEMQSLGRYCSFKKDTMEPFKKQVLLFSQQDCSFS